MRLRHLILEPTPAVKPENFRAYAFLAVGLLSAFVVHVVATSLFAMGGVYQMVGLNLVFSLPAYAIAFLWNRKGWHVAALGAGVVELCIHQSLSAYYVGPGAGLQWFLFVVPAVAFFVNPRHWLVQAAMLLGATTVAVAVLTLEYTPVYTLDPNSLIWLNALSVFTVFILLAIFGREYAYTAARIDGWLREQHAAAQETLRNSEAALSTWFAASADGQAMIDPVSQVVIRANPAMTTLLGTDPSALLGLRVQEFIVSRAGEPSWLERMSQAGVCWVDGVVLRRFDGTELVVDTTGAKAIVEGRGVLLVSFRDVTQRRQMEAALARSDRLATVGLLASGVAHEINNPITIVLNYAELIADSTAPGSREAEFAQGIQEAGERVATIVRNLQTFARPPELSPSAVELGAVVNRAASLISKLMVRDGIQLDVELPEGLPHIRCRSGNASQVIMGLLTNARDSLTSRYPGPHPEKRITLRAAPLEVGDKPHVRLTVADSGVGIPPDDLERIFHPFFTTRRSTGSAGLGLSLCQKLMQEDDGRILVESAPSTGAKFHLEWPVA